MAPSQWTWGAPLDSSLRTRASAIFLKAAKARGYTDEDEWLDELRFADFVQFQITTDGLDTLADGTPVKSEGGFLNEVVKHSITLVHLLEAKDVPKPIITRLSREARVRIDELAAAFLDVFYKKLKRANELKNRRRMRIRKAELFLELVIYTFQAVAREYMRICPSMDEFEAQLRTGLARYVEVSVGQHLWVNGAIRMELKAGLNFFRGDARPGAGISRSTRTHEWPVGTITAEALAYLARNLLAEATAHMAGRSHPLKASPKRKGAPRKFTDDQLSTAFEAKAAGKTNKDIAKGLYKKSAPSKQDVKNVPSILRYWRARGVGKIEPGQS
jgi:hypothetical protein